MIFTQKDFAETTRLASLLAKIDNMSPDYATSLSDEIFQRQPFFLAVLLGYRFDVTSEELEELVKIYLLMWEFFRDAKNVQTTQVTEAYFEQIEGRNIEMLKYIDGEPEQEGKMNIYGGDLENVKSKALLTAVLYRFNSRPVLLKMDRQTKGIIFIGIKSFIECFETI